MVSGEKEGVNQVLWPASKFGSVNFTSRNPPCPFNWIWYSSWLPVPSWGPWDCGAAAEQLLRSATEVLFMDSSGG